MIKIIAAVVFLFVVFVVAETRSDHFQILPRWQCIRNRKVPGCAGQPYNSSDVDGYYFYLFTRRNKETAEFLQNCNLTIPSNSNFNPDRLTIIIIYGFFENICNVASFRNMILEFLKRDDYNVIAVDWPNLVDFKEHVPVTADKTIRLIRNIKAQFNVGPDKFYLIGHSVGGNVIGLIGSREPVSRCTGIDASAPDVNAIHNYNPSSYPPLNTTCAPLVDIIHCDVGYCLPPLGNFDPKGCVNFYVNGGHFQESCYLKAFTAFLLQDFVLAIGSLIYQDFCFHEQCLQYFITSINPGNCQYVGIKCPNHVAAMAGTCSRTCERGGSNCQVMGFDWPKYTNPSVCRNNQSTSYFLKTKKLCPYCDNSWIRTNGFANSTGSSKIV